MTGSTLVLDSHQGCASSDCHQRAEKCFLPTFSREGPGGGLILGDEIWVPGPRVKHLSLLHDQSPCPNFGVAEGVLSVDPDASASQGRQSACSDRWPRPVDAVGPGVNVAKLPCLEETEAGGPRTWD